LEGKPEAEPKRGPGRPKGSRNPKRGPRKHVQIGVYLSDAEIVAFGRICDYWAASKAESIRTMIRYFDANLGLNKKPPPES
jgi:hypothetical protein